MTRYVADIELGKKYKDIDTGYEGVADRITFARNATPRVALIRLSSSTGEPVTHWFDTPQVQLIDGQEVGFRIDHPGNGRDGLTTGVGKTGMDVMVTEDMLRDHG